MANVVVKGEQIASGSTVYGQEVQIFKNTYVPALPGLGDSGFSVSVSGMAGKPPHTAGFASMEDVKKYLHGSGEQTFKTFDNDGNEQNEKRTALSIPRGMVSDLPTK
jgi:hypothetical protein